MRHKDTDMPINIIPSNSSLIACSLVCFFFLVSNICPLLCLEHKSDIFQGENTWAVCFSGNALNERLSPAVNS